MVGSRLRDLRREANMTQQALATALGINKHSVSCYELEKNEPSDEIKICICRHFDVTADFLLGLTEERRPLSDEPEVRVLRLPSDFPTEQMPELRQYADYLCFRSRQSS